MLRAFGFTCAGDLGAPDPIGGWLARSGPAEVVLERATEVESLWSGPCDPPRVGLRRVDVRDVRIERGRGGDVRMDWTGAGQFWIAVKAIA